jgi:hypothetical protein
MKQGLNCHQKAAAAQCYSKGVTSRDIASESWSKSGDRWTWSQLMCCVLSQSSSYISEVLLKMSGDMEEL